jgi:SAM-dependent methyltransferase
VSENVEQIADWDGPVGETWVEMQAELDAHTGPFGRAAMTAADARLGERIVDVGCGCGDTSIALAKAVGEGGAVLGVDVSRPMLAVARRRGAGLGNLAFRHADAAVEALPAEHDLIYSRFGVMFFDDPTGAFANMRGWLKASGRLAFCCWAPPRENPWAMVPVMAARQALNIDTPPPDPYMPGPFAFADIERLGGILGAAGFTAFDARPFKAPVTLGPTAEIAADRVTRFGPAYRLVKAAGEGTRPTAAAAIAKALAPYAAADGSVSLTGAVWIVTARAR